jgi:hypothetical protein
MKDYARTLGLNELKTGIIARPARHVVGPVDFRVLSGHLPSFLIVGGSRDQPESNG